MTISRPCYANRFDVRLAVDFGETSADNLLIDSALEQGADDVEGLCKRQFYPEVKTALFDWPNYQRAYPWRIWFDRSELADTTVNVPVVTTGGQVIPASEIFWGPWNYSPPFTFMELDRSSSATFGVGSTPQRDVSIAGTFGYWTKTTPTGALAAAMSDTTSTTMTVTNSAALGPGDVAYADSETLLVTDQAWVSTSQTQQGTGCSTASAADNLLGVTDGTKYFINEIVQLDAERMVVTAITGNNLTVKRAYDATVLATHSGATIYAPRQMTVVRGALGSTAATHLNAAALTKNLVPGTVRELQIAESLNTILQKSSGYARVVQTDTGAIPAPGQGLRDLRDRCYTRFGRKIRRRVI